MKAQQRHQLKQNDFLMTIARLRESAITNKNQLVVSTIAVLLIVVIGGGYVWWRRYTNEQANQMFGVAMATAEARIAPAPTVPGATQAPGTFPTDEARQLAALQAFQRVVEQYPSTQAGLAARYQMAAALLTLNQPAQAEKVFQDVIDRAGSSLYGPAARMGQAAAYVAQSQYDKAIKIYTDLSADRDSRLPVDGVLMELARAYAKAGKQTEARAAFKRIVDEFADSPYSMEARQQLTSLN